MLGLLVLGISSLFSSPTTVLIKTKPEGVAVYLGEEHLGDTPVEVELTSLENLPVLTLDGYKTQPVPPIQESEGGEAKVYVVMEKFYTKVTDGYDVGMGGRIDQLKRKVNALVGRNRAA